VDRLRLRVRSLDRDAGILEGESGLDFFSTGTRFLIRVYPAAAGTAVRIEARARTAVVDWGRSRREVERLFEALEQALGLPAAESEAAAAGPPAGLPPPCPACGAAPASAAARFCRACGAELLPPAPAPAARRCPACGQTITREDARFCSRCGASLS
jgi:hypothetical protein